jgi:NAD(P)-dependent dehydrogenase (short-subunit alcohol dehydrogenase family)
MRPGGSAGRGGSIVNVSSLGSKLGFAGLSSYGASKGAVEAITRCGAVEFARLGLGIRVNSVHPGFIRTGMVDRGVEAMVRLGFAADAQGVEQLLAAQFLGGFGSPEDVRALSASRRRRRPRERSRSGRRRGTRVLKATERSRSSDRDPLPARERTADTDLSDSSQTS